MVVEVEVSGGEDGSGGSAGRGGIWQGGAGGGKGLVMEVR